MIAAVHGLDRQDPPPADLARQMLDEIGGHWWNVYIGGPFYKGKGWTRADVRAYVQHGIARFMLTYVGRQKGGTLTGAQGVADAHDAIRLANNLGYVGHFPLCLDVEMGTYTSAPAATIEYAAAWCTTVRDLGARPGIYANPGPLRGMHGHVPADFVWVASWVGSRHGDHEPRGAPQMPAELWPNASQRAWQYAGAIGKTPCQVLGKNVDISVSDLDLLAHAPGVQVGHGPAPGLPAHAAAAPARPHPLRRGDKGAVVVQLTRRLSLVHSPRTGKPYLDGPRGRLDARAEAALKAFQADHQLTPSGILDPTSAHALARAVRLEQARRRQRQPKPTPAPSPPTPERSLVALVDAFRRLDAETDRAWKTVAAYGRERTRALEAEEADHVSLADVTAILLRIEDKLGALVEAERHEAEASVPAAVAIAPPSSPQPAVAAPSVNGDSASPPPTTHPRVALEDLSDEELLGHIDRLDRALDRSRAVLIARFARVEKRLGPAPAARTDPPTAHVDGVDGATAPAHRPAKPARTATAIPASDPVRNLQKLLDQFSQRYLKGMPPLVVDGKKGPATKQRIRDARFYLGYSGAGRMSTTVDPVLLRRLQRPRSVRSANPAMLARAARRRRQQQKHARQSMAPRAGVAMFEGKPVAAWVRPHLVWARQQGWKGTVLSGYRTPEYSEHLCMKKCGQPRCSGTCAGRSSNHSGRVVPHGAVDVTDAETFRALMRRSPHQPRILNALSRDTNHFSATGH
jgi:peptidoglycan hydrolase-like protein with peptidoglycan-binding domain